MEEEFLTEEEKNAKHWRTVTSRLPGKDLKAPPRRSTWQILMDGITDTFSEAGEGVNALFMRGNRDHREEQLIRSRSQERGLTPEQADKEVQRNRTINANRVRETRGQRQIRDEADPVWAGDKGVVENLTRGAASLAGHVIGDINPTYAIPVIGPNAATRITGMAGITGGEDMLVQGAEKAEGIIDQVDPYRTMLAAGAGALFQTPFELGRKAVEFRARRALARGQAETLDLDAAVAIGNRFGTVTSTIRSPSKNKSVGGVPNSFHLTGQAIDIARGKGVSHKQIERAYKKAGFEIIESLDEGDHSHLAFRFKPTAQDGAPGNASVRPMSPREIAEIMGDEEMMRALDEQADASVPRTDELDDIDAELLRQADDSDMEDLIARAEDDEIARGEFSDDIILSRLFEDDFDRENQFRYWETGETEKPVAITSEERQQELDSLEHAFEIGAIDLEQLEEAVRELNEIPHADIGPSVRKPLKPVVKNKQAFLEENGFEKVLTPAERQEMDASVNPRDVPNFDSSHEKFTPYVDSAELPGRAANDEGLTPKAANKIRFETGRPVVVNGFHGTAVDFDKFDQSKAGQHTQAPSAREAIWFATREPTANYYANSAAHRRNVIDPKYVRDENGKLVRNRKGKLKREPHTPIVKAAAIKFENPYVADMGGRVYREESYFDILQRAKEAGHDGVILTRAFDAGEYTRLDPWFNSLMQDGYGFNIKGETLYAVFNPDNIRMVPKKEKKSFFQSFKEMLKDESGELRGDKDDEAWYNWFSANFPRVNNMYLSPEVRAALPKELRAVFDLVNEDKLRQIPEGQLKKLNDYLAEHPELVHKEDAPSLSARISEMESERLLRIKDQEEFLRELDRVMEEFPDFVPSDALLKRLDFLDGSDVHGQNPGEVARSIGKVVDPEDPHGSLEDLDPFFEEPSRKRDPKVQKSLDKISDPNASGWINLTPPEIKDVKVFLKEHLQLSNKELGEMDEAEALIRARRIGYNKEWADFYKAAREAQTPEELKKALAKRPADLSKPALERALKISELRKELNEIDGMRKEVQNRLENKEISLSQAKKLWKALGKKMDEVLKLLERMLKDDSGELRGDTPEGTPAGRDGEDAPAPVRKLIDAINSAKPVRDSQGRAYSRERQKRIKNVKATQQSTSGERGFHAELAKLKGALPKIDYEPIRGQFSQKEIDELFDIVRTSNRLTTLEKVNARQGLSKLFGKEGSGVPSRSELRLLSEVFPEDFTKALMAKRPFGEKMWDAFVNAINLPRSIMSSFDLSAPLRQGVFMIGRKEFWKAFAGMFKYLGDKKVFQALEDEIASRPNYKLMRKYGLAISRDGQVLSKREEDFMSSWADKVPGVGRSNRAYMGFLNRLRADVFDSLIRDAKLAGVDLKRDEKAIKDIVRYINAATGRGDLGKLNQAAPVLSGLFFSPRLMASRFQLLNPLFYVRLSPVARKAALQSLLSFSGIALTVLSLADMAGLDVEHDPRSADFGKIRIGPTRFDILGGFQQYLRAGAQLISGQKKDTETGEIKNLGEGYKADTRLDVAARFFTNKSSPVASFVLDLLRGRNAVGEKVEFPENVIERFVPMITQDIKDLYEQHGAKGLLALGPAMFGVGVQSYSKEKVTEPFDYDNPPRTFKVDGEDYRLNDEAYENYKELSVRYFEEELEEMQLNNEEWPFLTEEEQKKEVSKVLRRARQDAKKDVLFMEGIEL